MSYQSEAVSRPLEENPERQARISELLPHFLLYLEHELRVSPQTTEKYRESLAQIVRYIGDLEPGKIGQKQVLEIKSRCSERGCSASRVSSLVYALRSFLKFCRLSLGIPTLDPKSIRAPRIPKREVVFLTAEEVQQFVSAIPIRRGTRGFHMRWLCFRALVEVLLGTGMRLSEALSLRRTSVNLETGEATIIGKGNKERVVFFSPRALNWVKEYLTRRQDTGEPMFVISSGKPLSRETAITWFRRFSRTTGLKKKVTAHILRHTMATTLLFHGCPVSHIRELLGHANLTTTCAFYLGCDKAAAKEAHRRYLDYEEGWNGSNCNS